MCQSNTTGSPGVPAEVLERRTLLTTNFQYGGANFSVDNAMQLHDADTFVREARAGMGVLREHGGDAVQAFANNAGGAFIEFGKIASGFVKQWTTPGGDGGSGGGNSGGGGGGDPTPDPDPDPDPDTTPTPLTKAAQKAIAAIDRRMIELGINSSDRAWTRQMLAQNDSAALVQIAKYVKENRALERKAEAVRDWVAQRLFGLQAGELPDLAL